MSNSDVAYLRAVRKAKVFQQLTDSVATDYSDDVVVDLLQKDDAVEPILDKAKTLLKDMIIEFDSSSPTTEIPEHQTISFILTDAMFKLWFIILLIVFLFISVLIFHFFCYAKKNVTRRGSLEKGSDETTTIEMSSGEEEEEEIEMQEKEESAD